MKSKNSTAQKGSARKTPRNTVSSPWVHKNHSNIVTRGRPKGSNNKNESKLKKKNILLLTPVVTPALTPEALKLQLALESPVPNEKVVRKRSSHRKRSSIHKSLNENHLLKESASTLVLESQETSKYSQNGENGFNLEHDDGMELDDTLNKSGVIEKQENTLSTLPGKDPANWNCNIL